MRKRADKHVFISYSSKDRRFADRITESLRSLGIRVWIDHVEIRPGEPLDERIEGAIDNADFVLVVLSPNSVNSKWCKVELRASLDRQGDENRGFVIPLLYRKCSIPLFLKGLLYIDFTDSKKFNAKVRVLMSALDEPELDDGRTSGHIAHPRSEIEGAFGQLRDEALIHFPFVAILHGTLRFNSIASRLREESLIYLSAMSNSYEKMRLVHIGALAAFMSDVLASENPINPDIVRLLASIVNSRQVHTDARFATLWHLSKILVKIGDRRLRQEVFPDIFPNRGFDPLTDRLVETLFERGRDLRKHPLAMLWPLASLGIRKEIASYLIRASIWSDLPSIGPELEAVEMGPLVRRMRPKWERTYEQDLGTTQFERCAAVIREAVKGQPSDLSELFGALELSGRITGAVYLEVLQALGLIGDDRIESLRSVHTDEEVFRLLTSLAASPYIGTVGALMIILTITKHFGIDCLLYAPQFPTCLFTPRQSESTVDPEPRSILRVLLEYPHEQEQVGSGEAGFDGDAEFFYVVLCKLILLFDSDALRWTLIQETGRIPEGRRTKSLEKVIRYARGEIGCHGLIQEPPDADDEQPSTM